MSIRVTFVLLVLLVVVGGYVLLFELQRRPPRTPEPPWFYNIDSQDITHISVSYEGKTQRFLKQGDDWVFEDTLQGVDTNRWSGIPFLTAGPRTKRTLEEQVSNPEQYGLSPPRTTIRVALTDGRQLGVFLGDRTADGLSYYGQVEGLAPLYTIDYSWGDILIRLVTEPPIPPPKVEETQTPGAATSG